MFHSGTTYTYIYLEKSLYAKLLKNKNLNIFEIAKHYLEKLNRYIVVQYAF